MFKWFMDFFRSDYKDYFFSLSDHEIKTNLLIFLYNAWETTKCYSAMLTK